VIVLWVVVAVMSTGTAAVAGMVAWGMRADRRKAAAPAVSPLPASWERHRTVEPARAAAADGRELHRAFERAVAGGWGEGLQVPRGSPAACRDLLAGVADTLLSEAASAALRGEESDERNARQLVWLEAYVRDALDGITDG